MPELSQLQVSTSSWLAKLQKTLETREWAECPVCFEEWTKLRPCRYLDDEIKVSWKSVCVVCAETLTRFESIASMFLIPGVEVKVRFSGPQSMSVKIGERIESMPRPANAYAIISYGDLKYIATSKGTGQPLRFKRDGSGREFLADNVFELVSKIKWALNHPLEEDDFEDKAMQTLKKAKNMLRGSLALLLLAALR